MSAQIRFGCVATLFVGAIGLFLASCNRSDGIAPREIDLGPEVGILKISLDTSFKELQHWIHKSDYRCGKELVWGGPHSAWPVAKDTDYLTISPDSLFLFTVRLFPNAPLECDSAVDVHQWVTSQISGLRTENPTVDIPANEIVTFGGMKWAFIQTRSRASLKNDMFVAFTEKNGRGIQLLWQRVAAAPLNFDFGTYCRSQFETVEFNNTTAAQPH